jgi:two-component system, response regulator
VNSGVILLVEDNRDDEDLARRALHEAGITNKVVVARDGVDALNYLFALDNYAGRDPGLAPALVLLDLNIPKVNGLRVLQRLRADPRTKLVPVVILTSSDEEHDVVQGYWAGANSYVRKPVDFGRFVEAIRQLGRYWLTLNEPLRRPPRDA